MWVAALVALLGACLSDEVTESECRRVFIAVCEQRVACGRAPDFQSCDDELRELYVCDLDRTKDEFRACYQATDTPCTESMAEGCYEVLCSKAIGCVDAPTETGAAL